MSHPVLAADWLLRLLGVGDIAGRQTEKARLALSANMPWPIVVGILIAAALWFGWLYRLDGARASRWLRALLWSLRMCAVAALLFMLLQPTLHVTQTQRVRATVGLLVDVSGSMGITDSRLPVDRAEPLRGAIGADPRGITRARVAEALLNAGSKPLPARLSERFTVRAWKFGTDTRPLDVQASAGRVNLAMDGNLGRSTQVGAAIRHTVEEAAGQPTAGLLLMSDGGSNLGPDPVAEARAARLRGLSISTLGVGDPSPTRDLAVTEVLADQVVRKDNVIQVFAAVAHRGYAGRRVTVTLRRGTEVIGAEPITLGEASTKRTVTFTYTPKSVGTYTWTVSVPELEGEVTHANNRRAFRQQVVDKQLKILYVEGEPRWEYRYLKNAILRDTQIAFSCYLAASGAADGGEGNVPTSGFPANEKDLFAYDIVLLGDVPRAHFSDLQLRNLRRFVEDRGGSLVVIAGEKHMPHEYAGTPLEAVLPVEISRTPEHIRTTEPFKWELTPEGRQDVLMRLSADAAENARIWANLPGMYWHAGTARARPGATVLAVNPTRRNASGKRVVVAVQPFGAGRCLVTLADSTWLWRYRVGDKHFYRFWGQVVRAMTPMETPGGNRYAQISVDRPEYVLGDRIAIHGRFLDAFFRPVKANEVKISVTPERGAPFSVALKAVPGSSGLFASDLLAERVGRFTLRGASPAQPGAPATASFAVQDVALELQQPEMNERLLREIAAAGGGRYYRPHELQEWEASLKDPGRTVRREVDIALWDAPVVFALFMLALSLEWLIRKRAGLL